MSSPFLSDLHDLVRETEAGIIDSPADFLRTSQPQVFDVLQSYAVTMSEVDPAYVPSGPAYLDVFSALRQLRVAGLAYAGNPEGNASMEEALRSGATQLDGATTRLIELSRRDLAAAGFPPAAMTHLSRLEETMEARRLASEVRDVRDAAVQVLDETRKAAGATGATAMSMHFADYARNERRTANLLRLLCAATLLLIAGLAAALLLSEDGGDLSTGRELGRLAVTLPLGVLAGYFGREAAGHRATARWARELEVQLLTMDAFSEPLSEASRDALRADLGRRALLGATGSLHVPAGIEDPVDIASLAERVAAVRVPGG